MEQNNLFLKKKIDIWVKESLIVFEWIRSIASSIPNHFSCNSSVSSGFLSLEKVALSKSQKYKWANSSVTEFEVVVSHIFINLIASNFASSFNSFLAMVSGSSVNSPPPWIVSQL